MIKYILVEWPEYQYVQDHPRYNECLFVSIPEDFGSHTDNGMMVPEDIYNEIFK